MDLVPEFVFGKGLNLNPPGSGGEMMAYLSSGVPLWERIISPVVSFLTNS